MIQEQAQGSAARQSIASCPGGHDASLWREFKVLYSSVAEMALLLLLFLLPLIFCHLSKLEGRLLACQAGEESGGVLPGLCGRCTHFSVSGACLFNTEETNQCHRERVLFLGTWGCAPGTGQGLLPVPPTTSPVHQSSIRLPWLVVLLLDCEGDEQPWQLLCKTCQCICVVQLCHRSPIEEGTCCWPPV